MGKKQRYPLVKLIYQASQQAKNSSAKTDITQ